MFFTILAEVCVLLCAGMQAQIGVLPKNDTRLSDSSDPKFHVGALWEYKTRSGEESSRLIVVKIDQSPELGMIVHVAVDNLTWRDCRNEPFSQALPHMPFGRKALETSLSKQMGEVKKLPDYRAAMTIGRRLSQKKRQESTLSLCAMPFRLLSRRIEQASAVNRIPTPTLPRRRERAVWQWLRSRLQTNDDIG
jgi:hypothetical protein